MRCIVCRFETPPGPDSDAYKVRQALLDLTLPLDSVVDERSSFWKTRAASMRLQRARYDRVFQGDILNNKEIVLYPSQGLTHDELLDQLEAEAPLALFPRTLHYFPRNRWIGAQEVTCECLLGLRIFRLPS